MNLIIRTQIDGNLKKMPAVRLLAMRKLSSKEMRCVRQAGISRQYLSPLKEKERIEFLRYFDEMWDELVEDYPPTHVFWRNVVSSKMQEWESSLTYLLLALFSLAKGNNKDQFSVLLLVTNVEEAAVCKAWALMQGWNVDSIEGKLKTNFMKCVQEITNIFHFWYQFLIICRKKIFSPHLRNSLKTLNGDKNILIATLSLPGSFQNGRYRDPFFGEFQKRVEGLGFKGIYLTDLLTNSDRRTAKMMNACPSSNVQLVCSVLSWTQIISIFFKLFFRSIKVNRVCFNNVEITKLIKWDFKRFSHAFNINAEMFYEAIKKICLVSDFKRLIIIFEGNVFERASIQAFRECLKETVCGYSHAVIFDLNLKLRLTGKEKMTRPEPDYFVCSGPLGKKLLQEVSQRPEGRIFDGCSLKGVPEDRRTEKKSMASKSILVALDGFWTSVRLLDWIIEREKLFSGYDVIVRCHPNVPAENILQQTIGTLPGNFRVSNEPLIDDIRKSMCVLYRHSSVGLQALLNGVPVIHLDVDLPLAGDPIMDVKGGKWRAQTGDELKKILMKIQRLTENNNWSALLGDDQSLCGYFSDPTEKKLWEFLSV